MLNYVQHHSSRNNLDNDLNNDVAYGQNVKSVPSAIGNGKPVKNALEDVRWIHIQLNTFKNWLNEHLSKVNENVLDIGTDFSDGIKLIRLVEILQNRRCSGKIYRNSPTQIQMLSNVQIVLDALRDDSIKLVNIGCYDIVEGNLKLILGLIWCLILRYQISGKTKIPPRKLLLAWLQAVLPELKIVNFTTNWNDGVALSALLNYCDPGIFQDWRSLNPRDNITNCSRAIRTAKEIFSVPTVLLPEDLANPNLDELSCMTYLSYFSKVGGPGYMGTLRRIRSLAYEIEIGNFTTDWNDGFVLCTIVHHLGAYIQGYPNLSTDRVYWIKNLTEGVNAAKKLGVEPLLSPEEMSDKEVHHMAILAYAARLCNIRPHEPEIKGIPARINQLPFATYYIEQQVTVEVLFLDRSLKLTELEPRIFAPNGAEVAYQQMKIQQGAAISFVPDQAGNYQVHVYCFGEEIKGSPVSLKVTSLPTPPLSFVQGGKALAMPQAADDRDIGKVSFSGLSEPCAVGSIVEVVTNAHGATSQGTVLVEANAPNGRVHKCQVHQRGTTYTATFVPQEIGDWTIAILYDGEHIRGSPFLCQVYDANLVQVYGLDVGVVGQELKFNVNTSQAGRGELKVQTYHHGRSIPCAIEKHGSGSYKVKFTPDGAGQYKIHVYYNNMEVKGSPFILDIVDASSVSVYGENLRMACVDKLATFMIHAVGADSKDLTVTISAPSGKKKRARIVPAGDALYRVEWKPVEAGEHYIDVRLYTQSVADSPFSCNVCDPDLVTVRNMPTKIKYDELGESHTFEIDATTAGSGNLEITINGGRVNCKVREIGSRLYLATFTPNQPITHIVEMRFNGESVKGSPWRVETVGTSSTEETVTSTSNAGFQLGGMNNVILAPINLANLPGGGYNYLANLYASGQNPQGAGGTTTTFSSEIERMTTEGMNQQQTVPVWAEIQGRGLTSACVGKVSSFDIGANNALKAEDIDVRILSPTARDVPCKVVATRSHGYRCEYIVSEVGNYRIDLALANRTVDGSPFMVSAYAPNKVIIEPIPGGAVGQPVQFYVDANQAGKGQLEIAVNQGRVPNSVQMQGAGRCLVTFIPEYEGIYVIDVTFNGELVRGCPIRVEILTGGSPSHVDHTSTYRTETTLGRGGRQSPSPILGPRSSSPLSKGFTSSSFGYERKEYVSQYSGGDSRTTYESSYTQPVKALNYPDSPEDNLTSRPFTSSYTTSSVTRAAEPEGRVISYELKRPSQESGTFTSELQFKPLQPSNGFTSQVEKTTYVSSNQDKQTSYPSQLAFTKVLSSSKEKILDDGGLKRDRSADRLDSYEKRFEYRSTEGDSYKRTFDTGTEHLAKYDQYEPRPDYKTTEISTSIHPTQQKVFEKDEFPRSTYETPRTIEHLSKFDGSITGSERFKADDEMVESAPVRRAESEDWKQKYDRDTDITFTGAPRVDRQLKYHVLYPIKSNITDDSPSAFGAARPTERFEREKFWNREVSSTGGAVTVASYGDQPKRKTSPTIKTVEYYSKTETANGVGVKQQAQLISSGGRGDSRENNLSDVSMNLQPIRRQSDGTQLLRETQQLKRADQSGSKLIEMDRPTGVPLAPPLPDAKVKHHRTSSTDSTGSWVSEKDESAAHKRDVHAVVEDQKQRLVGTIIEPAKELKQQTPIDLNAVKVEGPGIGVIRIKKPTSFDIKPLQCDKNDVKVVIMSPTKEALDSRVRETRNGLVVEFTPSDVGTHRVHVTVAGQTHPQSPFTFRVYDPDKIQIGGIKGGVVGDVIEFTVDATNAGYGNLEIAVADKSGAIVQSKVTPQEESTAKFYVSFVPTKVGDYFANITFNGENLKNSPFKCQIDAKKATTPLTAVPMSPAKESLTKLTTSTTTSGANGTVAQTESIPVRDLTKKLTPVKHAVSFDIAAEGSAKPKVDVKGPNGKSIPTKITNIGSSAYRVEFTPEIVGDHIVEVSYADVQIEGSPFNCRVYDSQKISVGEISNFQIGQAVHFVVDASEAGVGNLEVAVNEGRIPSMAHSLGNHRYDISFVPRDSLDHTISIRFNNESVPGSPFVCKMVSSNQAVANGPGLERIPVRKQTYFFVDPQGSATQAPTVNIKDPSGQEVEAKISSVNDNRFRVEYTPENAGSHQIDIRFGSQRVNDSPFIAKVYDSSKVKLFPVEGKTVGKPANFLIDAAKAGAGNMEIIVSVDGRNLPNFVQAEGNAKFKVSFSPQEAKPHVVSVKFNGEPVPGSPMTCPIVDGANCAAYGDGLQQAVLNKPSSFLIDPKGADHQGDCNVIITDKSKRVLPCSIKKQTPTSVSVEFVPKVVGPNLIEVFFAETSVKGSPFVCEAFDLSAVKVVGLKDGNVGREQQFKIDYGKAGKGYVDVLVENNKSDTVRHALNMVDDSSCICTFVPKTVGPYKVDVSFNGVVLPECPYEFVVRDSSTINAQGPGLRNAFTNSVAHFVVNLHGAGKGEFDVVVTDPSGGAVPVKCFQQKDGNYRVEYTPALVGDHKVDVTFADQPISGSPFTAYVIEPNKLKVSDLRTTLVNQEVSVLVSKKGAGKGELSVRLTDPHGKVVRTEVSPVSNVEDEIRFVPSSVGQHQLSVSFAGVDAPGTPIFFSVDEPGKPGAHGEGLQRAIVKETTNFVVEAKKLKGDLKVEVLAPNHKGIKPAVNKKGDGVYEISYTPTEPGPHTVSLSWNQQPLAGSPYSVSVVDPDKVHVMKSSTDNAWRVPMKVGVPKELKIETADAGPGKLRTEVKGPNGKVPVISEELGGGNYRVVFTPTVEGQHDVYMYWSDVPVPHCPIVCFAEDAATVALALKDQKEKDARQGAHSREDSLAADRSGLIDFDASRVSLKGDGLKHAKTKDEAEFLIDGSDAGAGNPNCIMTGQKADVPVVVVPIGNNIWKATYTPFIAGTYNLTVLWANKPVKGSPFKVNVLAGAEAGKVNVNTDSLKMGVVGQDLKTTIDTRRAGPGELTAQCVGPNKVAYCELFDHRDGTYVLNIKPQETGKHNLIVKYNSEHVSGSPFTVFISNSPDPSKVRVYGPGIEHGILSRFKSNFVVDTKGAGAGQLTVRMRGPKGAFNVEMQRDRKSGRLINCKYEPKEQGDYQVEVKWAGEHVPGSPFLVMIFDTQQELERYMAGQPVTSPQVMPFLPPGYVGPPPPGMPPGMMMPTPPPPGSVPNQPPGNYPSPRMPYGGGGPGFYGGTSPRRYIAQNGY